MAKCKHCGQEIEVKCIHVKNKSKWCDIESLDNEDVAEPETQ